MFYVHFCEIGSSTFFSLLPRLLGAQGQMHRWCTPGQPILRVHWSQSHPRPPSSWPLAGCPACSTQGWLTVSKRGPAVSAPWLLPALCGMGPGNSAGCTLGCASVELHVIFLWVAAENAFPFLVQGDVKFIDPGPWSPLSPMWALWPWNTLVIAGGSLQTIYQNFCCAQGNASWLPVYWCSPLKHNAECMQKGVLVSAWEQCGVCWANTRRVPQLVPIRDTAVKPVWLVKAFPTAE